MFNHKRLGKSVRAAEQKRLARTASLCMAAAICLMAAVPTKAGSGAIVGNKLNLSVYFKSSVNAARLNDWKSMFAKANSLLWNATEGRLQLGTITIFNGGCEPAKDDIDIVVGGSPGDAESNSNGLGEPGAHIFLSESHYQTTSAFAGHFTLIHEIGHYVFNLEDEYRGCAWKKFFGAKLRKQIPTSGAADWHESAITTTDGTQAFFCQASESGAACIMDGGGTITAVNNRTEFCTSTTHQTERGASVEITSEFPRPPYRVGTLAAGEFYFQNSQECIHHAPCWKMIANKLGSAAPVNVSTTEPGGLMPVQYQDGSVLRRIILTVDNSGSVMGSPLEWSKRASRRFIDECRTNAEGAAMMCPGDELGIVKFNNFASDVSQCTPLASAADKTAKQQAIDTIENIEALTDLGGGLQLSVNQLTARGAPAGREAVVLLSDGQPTTGVPYQNVLPQLVARGMPVYCISTNKLTQSGTTGMQVLADIANQTGGKLFEAHGYNDIPIIVSQVHALIDGNTVINQKSKTHAEQVGQTLDFPYTVDDTVSRTKFELASPNYDVTLMAPDGTESTPSNLAPGVTYVNEGMIHTYTAPTPGTGVWTLLATRTGGQSPEEEGDVATIAVAMEEDHSNSTEIYVSSFPYVFWGNAAALFQNDGDGGPSDVIRVKARVNQTGPVLGATVIAEVHRPDNTTVEVTLVDNGDPNHDDVRAGDGVYSHVFRELCCLRGEYTFHVRVDTTGAVRCTGCTAAEGQSDIVPAVSTMRYASSAVTFASAGDNFPYVFLFPPTDGECLGTIGSFQMNAEASDGDFGHADILTYHWTTDCPGGWFDDPFGAAPRFLYDPALGPIQPCEIVLTVSDPFNRVSETLPVNLVDNNRDGLIDGCDQPQDPSQPPGQNPSGPGPVFNDPGSGTGSPTSSDACGTGGCAGGTSAVLPLMTVPWIIRRRRRRSE